MIYDRGDISGSYHFALRRHKNDVEAFNKEGSGNKPDSVQEEVVDEFDTRISGPWMTRWPIKHHNRHTALAGIAPPTKD